MKVDFEFTTAEAAEMQMQQLETSRTAMSWRRREQMSFVVALVVTIVVMGTFSAHDRSPQTVLVIVVGALVAGLVLFVPFGWYAKDRARTRMHVYLREQLGGEGPHFCSVELRPEHLWVRQAGIELLFPWSEAVSVSDEPDGILVAFRNGRVLARNRGFTSPEQRNEFQAQARALAASAIGVQPK